MFSFENRKNCENIGSLEKYKPKYEFVLIKVKVEGTINTFE